MICLLPGEALLRLEPFLSDRRLACRRFRSGKDLPDRLFGFDGAAVALFIGTNGKTELAGVDADSAKGIGLRRPGPILGKGQRISQIFRNADGRTLVAADDATLGFQLWREQHDGTWTHLIADGAASALALDRGIITRLDARAGGLVAVALQPDGTGTVYGLSDARHTTTLGRVQRPICAVVGGENPLVLVPKTR